MPHGGHLEWKAVYTPGSVKAVGYKAGKKVCTEIVRTSGSPASIQASTDRAEISGDGRDLSVINLSVYDAKGNFVPDACVPVTITVEGPVRILGVGNGDPAFRAKERPEDPSARTFTIDTFNGLAQVLIQSAGGSGKATVTFSSDVAASASTAVTISLK